MGTVDDPRENAPWGDERACCDKDEAPDMDDMYMDDMAPGDAMNCDDMPDMPPV